MKFCCERMDRFTNDLRIPISYIDTFNVYKLHELEQSNLLEDYLIEKDVKHFGKILKFCPLCGKALPKSLFQKWKKRIFTINKANCFKDKITWLENNPTEFKSSKWRLR